MNSPITQGYGARGRPLIQGYGGPGPSERPAVVGWYPGLRRPRKRLRRAPKSN